MNNLCRTCGTPATLKCGGCKEVFYCNQECQKTDRKIHTYYCQARKLAMEMDNPNLFALQEIPGKILKLYFGASDFKFLPETSLAEIEAKLKLGTECKKVLEVYLATKEKLRKSYQEVVQKPVYTPHDQYHQESYTALVDETQNVVNVFAGDLSQLNDALEILRQKSFNFRAL